MLPDNFFDLYPYVSGDFYAYEYSDDSCYATLILYAKYDEQNYEEAKSYVLENRPVKEESKEEYCGFTFYMRDLRPEDPTRAYFGFCNETRTILSMVTYRPGGCSTVSVAEHAETYFDFFNFETVTIERHLFLGELMDVD